MRHEDDDEDARNPKGDWPGTCPGPSACQYSGRRADDDPDDDGAED